MREYHFLTLPTVSILHFLEEKEVSEYAIAAFMTAMGIAAPIGLKALAVIAVKALVISKIALTIAFIVVLKKLFKGEHKEEKSVQLKDHNRRNVYLNSLMHPAAQQLVMPVVNGGVSGGATGIASTDPYNAYYQYPAQLQTSQ